MCAAVRNENRTQVSDGVHWKIFHNRRSRPARHVSNNKSPKLKECARQKSKNLVKKCWKNLALFLRPAFRIGGPGLRTSYYVWFQLKLRPRLFLHVSIKAPPHHPGLHFINIFDTHITHLKYQSRLQSIWLNYHR